MAKQYVSHVKLQTAMHLPNVGEMGSSLPSVTKTVDNLTMFLTPEGLYVAGSRVLSGRRNDFKAVIPYGNIVIMQLSEVEETAPTKAEKNGNKKD